MINHFSYFSTKTHFMGNQNEPSLCDGPSKHPKHMLRSMFKKVVKILPSNFLLIRTFGNGISM